MFRCMRYRKIFLSNCIISFLVTLLITWYLCFYITSPMTDDKTKASSGKAFEAMLDNNRTDTAERTEAIPENNSDTIKADKMSVDVKKEIEDFSYSEEDDSVVEMLFDRKFVSDDGNRTFVLHKDGSFDGFFDSSRQSVTGYKYSISNDGGKRILRISDPSYRSYISYELSLDYDKLDLYYKKGDFHMRFSL